MKSVPTTEANPEENTKPSSHVTAAPVSSDGHGFDPRLRSQYANEPKVVHTSRSVDPAQLEVSDRNQLRHERSKKKYPHLNLSNGEFVVLDIKRHPIGLIMPVVATGFIIVMLMIVLIIYPSDTSMSGGLMLPSFEIILWPLMLLMLLVASGGLIAIWVYLQNQFYLTNESVIQEIQHGLFSRHEQTVSLGSIEDASFKQTGIFQTMMDYGTIRLSTEGEETTYRFSYVSNPRKQIAILNNAVEAFKNGRPVDPYET